MRRIFVAGLVLGLVVGCAGGERPAETAAPQSSRGQVVGVRTAQGVILQVKTLERLSAEEAKLTVRIFNPGAVPLPQKVGPEYFFVGSNEGTELPVRSVDAQKTTLTQKELVPREATEGELFLKLPGPGAMKLYYGETPEINIFVVRIPAAES
ncbi:hypothetical protein [Gloeobacter violaceus]|uniref:Gll3670 protein n=1 Tax=Gloeobacter violaceus (strain ATCC 29082 / PCC 7421) TaxID=251221 RepID=Q7NF56_GLOVI|nr:hypothetical protein [Gloeobacter violaceus]BAC91611.1 gll3670 [Gloeobacter violaceus PCC 7421]